MKNKTKYKFNLFFPHQIIDFTCTSCIFYPCTFGIYIAISQSHLEINSLLHTQYFYQLTFIPAYLYISSLLYQLIPIPVQYVVTILYIYYTFYPYTSSLFTKMALKSTMAVPTILDFRENIFTLFPLEKIVTKKGVQRKTCQEVSKNPILSFQPTNKKTADQPFSDTPSKIIPNSQFQNKAASLVE